MEYFQKAYDKIQLRIGGGAHQGLRRAQLGAIHAISSYFTLPQKDPGIVVLPTGAGKTAVIFLAAFMLRAKRALIVTPSQLVRSQIAENAKNMDVLKRLEVFPLMEEGPKVIEVKNRMVDKASWNSVLDSDLVVSTPNCISPGIAGNVEPPPDAFDLILMDEAHHSEARIWADILRHFSHTKRLLFTATPFRQDKREVRGKFIYTFPLREAHKDGIFGNIRFVPVNPPQGGDHDVAIARATEAVYKKDQAKGLQHRIMVRTDSISRAQNLAKVYEANTKLRLAVVHSRLTFKNTERALVQLSKGELDGIICVAMLGEGFDFPQLKIAAIHTPHKSLAVTLQFIGRFARTNNSKVGEAKFLAVPQDISSETDELYRESAAWLEIVANLSAAKVDQETKIKEISSSFVQQGLTELDIADVIMTDFRPFFHVKIYSVDDAPNLSSLPTLPENIKLLRFELSEQHSSVMLLLRQTTIPRWTTLEQFSRVEYDFVVIVYEPSSKLLFLNSTRRTLEFYKFFEEHYGRGTATLLSGPKIGRVLAGLTDTEFFSLGLRNNVQNSNSESYQIKSGPSAQKSISPTDGLRFRRGHVMGKGREADGGDVTIGYSSSSKVWRNYAARVSELVTWCQALAIKLSRSGSARTGTELDLLDPGEEITQLPIGVIGAGWPDKVYKEFPHARLSLDSTEHNLLDFDLSLNLQASTDETWIIRLNKSGLSGPISIAYSIQGGRPVYKWADVSQAQLTVIRDDEEIPLIEYFRHYPPPFYLEDFSRVEGAVYFKNDAGDGVSLKHDQILAVDWKSTGINIELEINEKGLDLAHPQSIQDHLAAVLFSSSADIVFFDHGPGEMADFITFSKEGENAVKIGMYHCKGSGGPMPGDRVSDVYEVCGQVVKCLLWLKNKQRIRGQIQRRDRTSDIASHFIKGSIPELYALLPDGVSVRLEFEICVVQPGILSTNISEKLSHVLGAASEYVGRACNASFKVLCS